MGQDQVDGRALMTDADVAELYARIYEEPFPAGFFDTVIDQDGCFVAIKTVGSVPYVCFRGSVTVLDWFEDFSAFAAAVFYPGIGMVHNGFLAGVLSVKQRLDEALKPLPLRPVMVGHSLGAGHAFIYAGLRTADCRSLGGVVAFGEPRPGMDTLGHLLAAEDTRSYRNMDAGGHDLVTDVPLKIPPLLGYRHPKALIDVTASPDPDDDWGLLRYHHFSLYVRALHAKLG